MLGEHLIPSHEEEQEAESSQKKRKSKRLPSAITEEEFFSLMKHTKKIQHKIAFLLGFGSGLRISEIVGRKREGEAIPPLTPDRIDLQRKTIFIYQGKGRKDRIVPLPKGFKEWFLKYLPIKVTPRALEKAFKNAARKAGLLEKKPDLHFHSLRHGFGTTFIEKGGSIELLKILMGHSNISTTDIYIQLNPKKALEAYEKLF